MTQTRPFDSPQAAFAAAAERIGQTRLGQLCKRTQGAVSKRLSQGKAIWDTGVLHVEEESGISRHDLRPDLYPREDTNHARQPGGQPSDAALLPGSGGSSSSALEGVRA